MTDRLSVILTAGYNRSPAAGALLQLLARDGVKIAGVLLVNPLQLSRISKALRDGGFRGLLAAGRKAAGASGGRTVADPLETFFAESRIEKIRLDHYCRAHGIPFARVSSLNGDQAAGFVEMQSPSGVIYCGGGIIKRSFLERARGKVLNAHAGPLPRVRGMNAAEWSILLGLRPEATIHFIDQGIDTGPTVAVVPVDLQPGDDLFMLRQRAVAAGIVGLRQAIPALDRAVPPRAPDALDHAQLFTLAPALADLVDHRLRQRVGTSR